MQPFNPRIRETYRRIGDWTGHGSDTMWSIGSSVGGIDAGGVGWCTSMPADDNIKRREQCPPAPEGLGLDFITEQNSVTNRARRVEHLQVLSDLAVEGRITGISAPPLVRLLVADESRGQDVIKPCFGPRPPTVHRSGSSPGALHPSCMTGS